MQELELIYKDTRDKMDKAIDALRKEIMKIRTGKANISLLNDITVDYYGSALSSQSYGNDLCA